MNTILKFKGTEDDADSVAVLAGEISGVREYTDYVEIVMKDGSGFPVNATLDDVVAAWASAISALVINHE